MRYWLVMPAAGSGRRFRDPDRAGNPPKQYADLLGRPVIEWALAPFVDDPRCTGIVVALAPGDPHWPTIAVRSGLQGVRIAQGGAERGHSVRSGLAALAGRAAAEDWVLVHDAARPCLARTDLD
ncbi:MAG: 2-C-methyl-D-erythritol 4-phosphate cytidylyltransferase, partial [Steroidobacteraceae bacterium]